MSDDLMARLAHFGRGGTGDVSATCREAAVALAGLHAALLRIDAINDNPHCYNSAINEVIEALNIQQGGRFDG